MRTGAGVAVRGLDHRGVLALQGRQSAGRPGVQQLTGLECLDRRNGGTALRMPWVMYSEIEPPHRVSFLLRPRARRHRRASNFLIRLLILLDRAFFGINDVIVIVTARATVAVILKIGIPGTD